MLRDHLLEIASNYDEYLSQKTVDKGNRMHALLTSDIPDLLQACTPRSNEFSFQGSDGDGNITTVPWVATFHKQITDTARLGFYVVWLIPRNRKEVILELGLGATQFSDLHGQNKRALSAMALASQKIVSIAENYLPSLFSASLQSRITKGQLPPLDSAFRHVAYGKSAIVSVTYSLDHFPDNSRLVEDYQSFIRLYQRLVSSPLMPTNEELILDEVLDQASLDKDEDQNQILEVKPFIKRVKKERTSSTNSIKFNATRYSRVSKKIGDAGEVAVFNFLKNQLQSSKHPELAEKVIWHQEDDEDKTPGWDITSFDQTTGQPMYVEVKATQGSSMSELTLTRKEWEMAKTWKSQYFIFIVTNALKKNPTLEILQNPALLVENGEVLISEASWSLKL